MTPQDLVLGRSRGVVDEQDLRRQALAHRRVQPGDAAVYLDDRFAGTGEELSTLARGLSVSPGPHRIVVSRPGFSSDASMVDVGPGSTEKVEISLEK